MGEEGGGCRTKQSRAGAVHFNITFRPEAALPEFMADPGQHAC